MLKLVLLFSFLLSIAWASETEKIKTTIELVDVPKNTKLETLIFAHTEGRVLRVNTNDKTMVKAFQKAKSSGREIEVEIDENGNVLGASLLKTVKKKSSFNPFRAFSPVKPDTYEPSVVTMDQAEEIFEGMHNRFKKRSQCFNRAHIWANELWNRYSLKSMKVFLFFTRKYIREYNFHWWFHVSPFVYVKTPNGVVERTLDYTFAEQIEDMQSWINLFMLDNPNCPEVQKYSDYEKNQESKYCYLIKTNMFVWEPNNIEEMETEGKIPSSWDYSELAAARKQAQ